MKKILAATLVATFMSFIAVPAFADDGDEATPAPRRQYGACEQYNLLRGQLAHAEKGVSFGKEALKATAFTAGGSVLNYGFSKPSAGSSRGSKTAVAKGAGYGLIAYAIETVIEHKVKSNKNNKLKDEVSAAAVACAEEQRHGYVETRMWSVEDRDAAHSNAIEVAKIRASGSGTMIRSSLDRFGAEQDAKFREFEARMSAVSSAPVRNGDNNITVVAPAVQRYCNLFREGDVMVSGYRVGAGQCQNLPAGATQGTLVFRGSSFTLSLNNGVQISNGVVKFYNPNQN